MKKIYKIFKEYKYKLSLIYIFMIITELSTITQPYLLGKSIDGLINGTYFWLILLFISYFISILFNYKRMVYDTKVYTKIYNNIVLNFLKNTNEDNSKKIARTEMAHEIVGVLEGYVHYYIAVIITIFGSIIFIYKSNWQVGLLTTFAFFIIILAVLVFYKKMRQSINIRNNHYENKVNAIQNGYNHSVSFFNRRRKLDIFSSTLQGKNWFLVGIIKSVFLVLSIIILITTSNTITTGNVITLYSYINDFLISLMSIPVAFDMYSRLTNVIKRIDYF
jgi:ABC-type multidrug transport system fused ATPase/permease subunit